MLKIKEYTNFKELSKYGFKRTAISSFFIKNVHESCYDYISYQIYGKTREFTIMIIGHPKGMLDNTIYDMIKDGILVKEGE